MAELGRSAACLEAIAAFFCATMCILSDEAGRAGCLAVVISAAFVLVAPDVLGLDMFGFAEFCSSNCRDFASSVDKILARRMSVVQIHV